MVTSEAAIRALYAQHASMVLAYAEGFTGDRRAAQEVVQETFLHAWQNLPRLLADEQPPREWLLHAARDLLTDPAAPPRGSTAYDESRPS